MAIDYFSAAEHDLQSLTTLKRSLDILRKRRERLIQAGAPKNPGTVNFSKPYVDVHTVNDTLGDLLALSETGRDIEKTESEITQIELALEALPKEQKQVLIYFYIDGLTVDVIAEKIYVESAKTVYRIRNRGIANFALLMYGSCAKQICNQQPRKKRGKK